MRTGIDRNVNQALRWTFLACAAGWLSAGCGATVHNATVQSAGTIAPAADQATIVVVQPSTHFRAVSVLDGHGQLLGQINDRSHTVIHVPAGAVRLYAFPERKIHMGDRIDGTVQAGRIYYVTVSFRWGGVSFLALNQRSPDARWAQKEEYVTKTSAVEMDAQKAPVAVREIGDPGPIMQQIDTFVDGLDAAHHAERMIQAEDGI
jgi:hypothetical protein